MSLISLRGEITVAVSNEWEVCVHTCVCFMLKMRNTTHLVLGAGGLLYRHNIAHHPNHPNEPPDPNQDLNPVLVPASKPNIKTYMSSLC